MDMKRRFANDKHTAFMSDLKAVIAKHEPNLSSLEILAIISQLLGMLVAFQDATKLSPETIMEMVARNMQVGNKIAIGEPKGNV